MNELIKDYAAQLRRIYSNRSAGDFTFEGVLASFMLDATEQALVKIQSSEEN